jgi:hypothetical protein
VRVGVRDGNGVLEGVGVGPVPRGVAEGDGVGVGPVPDGVGVGLIGNKKTSSKSILITS